MPNDNERTKPGGLLGLLSDLPIVPVIAFIGASAVMIYQVRELSENFNRLDRETTQIMMRLASADALSAEFKSQIGDGIARITSRIDNLARDMKAENRDVTARLRAIEVDLARMSPEQGGKR